MSVAVKSANKVLSSALALPPKSRAKLADKLLASLDKPHQAQIDALWAAESEERIRAFEAGRIQAINGQEVFRSLRTRKKR